MMITVKDHKTLCLAGEWTLRGISDLVAGISSTHWPRGKAVVICGEGIARLDSAGAWLIQRLIKIGQDRGKVVQMGAVNPAFQHLFNRVRQAYPVVSKPIPPKSRPDFLYQIGFETEHKYHQILGFLNLLGELVILFFRGLFNPHRFQFPSIINTIEISGYRALPIIALLIFLIGVVIAYQFGIQLEFYGANIFIVNLTGMAILREFGPLVTAIVLAGRTSSAFTAQIGMMKVNEEVDALCTMGLSPAERLILPKLFGLMIALPLLTLWANVFGVLGSMMVSDAMLEIGYADFLQRFANEIPLRHYLIGLGKAPIFAFIIASIGCYQGMQVKGSAVSVGAHTTKAVVQAIFLIILTDAFFSVIFSKLGW